MKEAVICLHLSTGENIIGIRTNRPGYQIKDPFVMIYARDQGMIGFDRWMYYLDSNVVDIVAAHVIATYKPRDNLVAMYHKFCDELAQMGPEELSYSDEPPGLLQEDEQTNEIDEEGDVIPPKNMLN